MKNIFCSLLVIMLAVSGLALGGQFLGIQSNHVVIMEQSSENTYTYEYNGQIYESDFSEDDAWTKAMIAQVEQENLTMADVEIEYLTFGSRGIVEIPQHIMPMSSGSSLTGNVEWQPNTGTSYLPLQRVKVELYMHWGNLTPLKVDETYTTDNGSYSFDNFSLWEELAIIGFGPIWTAAYQTYSVRIYPESETFRVARDWLGVNLLDSISSWVAGVIPNWFAYYVSSSTGTWFWQSSGNFGTIKIPYDENGANETHNAFYISQSLVMGQRFVQDACGYSINKFLNVLYPFSNETPFCFDVFMGMGRSWFDDWQTSLHEYGHFVEHNVGTNNVRLDEYFSGPGPNHTGIEDHISLRGKSIGTRFAWTEAWAEAFSYVVIDHYTTGYYASGQALGVGGAEVLGTNINIPTTNADSGEGQEAAITAFLWYLSQQQFFGHNDFWNTTTISGTFSLSDLVNTLDTQYSEYRSQIGTLMDSFKIAPQILTSTYMLGSSIPPTITWRVNGSQNNPNNQFRIAFYNLDGVLKYETDNISFTLTPAAAPNQNRRDLDVANYTLTQQEYNNMLLNFTFDETIHIAVKGYRTGSPLTGPYWSATIPEIPESLALSQLVFTLINNGNDYSVTNILDKQFTGLVRIPNTFNGKDVTHIGSSAFNSNQLSKIIIPSSVTNIGTFAFHPNTNIVFSGNHTHANCVRSYDGFKVNFGKTVTFKHKAYCYCGVTIEQYCTGKINEFDNKPYCIHCEQDMSGGLGGIINKLPIINEQHFIIPEASKYEFLE